MSILKAARQRTLDQIFGRGVGGFFAASAIGWGVDQIRASLKNEPQRLDLATLVPGETYVVTTRPPMTKEEAKIAARHEAVSQKLAKTSRPSRKVKRTARALSAAQRSSAKAKPGTSKALKIDAKAARLATEFDRLTTPSPKQAQLQATVDELAAQLAKHRAVALQSSRPKSSRTRTKVFR